MVEILSFNTIYLNTEIKTTKHETNKKITEMYTYNTHANIQEKLK